MRTWWMCGLIWFCLAGAAWSGDGEWTYLGGVLDPLPGMRMLAGGNPTRIYVYPINNYDRTEFLASSDGGKTWRVLRLPPPELGVGFSIGGEGRLILDSATDGALYYQNTYREAGGFLDPKVEPVAYVSTDDGLTWARTDRFPAPPADPSPVAVSPNNPSIQWRMGLPTGEYPNVPFRSGDAGKTWRTIQKGSPSRSYPNASFLFDPRKPERIYLFSPDASLPGVYEYTEPSAVTDPDPPVTDPDPPVTDPDPPVTMLKGDVTGDGRVSVGDAIMVLRMAVGLIPAG